jgi:hypothetical protein
MLWYHHPDGTHAVSPSSWSMLRYHPADLCSGIIQLIYAPLPHLEMVKISFPYILPSIHPHQLHCIS